MLIAVCDDEKFFRDQLKEMLIKYKTKHHLHIDIYEFASGVELLRSDLVFDMVFMDYQMPELNGMEAARALRKRNTVCSIVFVTSYPSFMIEAFEVQPYRFFLKPLTENDVFSMLSAFIANQKLLAPITVINDYEQKVINAKDIIYLEGNDKCCVIRTLDNTYYSSKTLKQVHSLLPQHCFYRTHKSYVINLYCVDKISDRSVVLTNDEKVAVGKSKVGEFKRHYADFIKNYYLRV